MKMFGASFTGLAWVCGVWLGVAKKMQASGFVRKPAPRLAQDGMCTGDRVIVGVQCGGAKCATKSLAEGGDVAV